MKLGERLLKEEISLETSLNFVSDGLMIVNKNLEVLFFNKSARDICGLLPEGDYHEWPNFVGVYTEDRKLYDPDRLPIVRATRGEIVQDENLYLRNDIVGEWKVVCCSTSPIYKDNEINGAILTFKDITFRLKQEEEIRKERESFHKILNALPAYVFAKDLDGNYTFLNDNFKNDFIRTFGTAPTHLNKDMKWEVAKKEAEVIATKKPIEVEESFPNVKTGETYHFRTTRIPLIDSNGEVYGICGISSEISQERERKKQLEEERTKIATASKLAALGMLAAEIGHEINNPLAIIRTGSWILRKILSSDNYQKDLALTKLDEIDETVQRMSEIVTSIKNLSRDSSREKNDEYVIGDILHDVQSICIPKFQPKGIEFRTDRDNPLLQARIRCYRVQLSEVLINLIVNAVDAIEECETPWIRLRIFEEGNEVIFQLTDSGNGVPQSIEQNIFRPFFSTKEIGKGTGLGLSISKEIMKKHGGDLILNRRVSDNCFEARLPRR